MTLTLSDKSNYLNGMLVLIGKDRDINHNDEKIIRSIADELGFNHYFVDNSINELKTHQYFLEDPPEFSSREVAKVFIIDGIRVAFLDHSLHLYELQWLTNIASKNNLTGSWLYSEIENALNNNSSQQRERFEFQKHLEHELIRKDF